MCSKIPGDFVEDFSLQYEGALRHFEKSVLLVKTVGFPKGHVLHGLCPCLVLIIW